MRCKHFFISPRRIAQNAHHLISLSPLQNLLCSRPCAVSLLQAAALSSPVLHTAAPCPISPPLYAVPLFATSTQNLRRWQQVHASADTRHGSHCGARPGWPDKADRWRSSEDARRHEEERLDSALQRCAPTAPAPLAHLPPSHQLRGTAESDCARLIAGRSVEGTLPGTRGVPSGFLPK